MRSEALESAGTKIVIIGCGDWLLINNYRGMSSSVHRSTVSPIQPKPTSHTELTNSINHPLISFYADPTRHVYRSMGLTAESLATTPSEGPRRSYMMDMGKWANAARSMMVSFQG